MRQFLYGSVMFCIVALPSSKSANALSLEDAILFVLETNPEITAAESNKQAIDFWAAAWFIVKKTSGEPSLSFLAERCSDGASGALLPKVPRQTSR